MRATFKFIALSSRRRHHRRLFARIARLGLRCRLRHRNRALIVNVTRRLTHNNALRLTNFLLRLFLIEIDSVLLHLL